MELNIYLLLALLIALLVIAYLLAKLHRVRGQLSLIKDALTDIKNGNLNRRVLARKSDLTKQDRKSTRLNSSHTSKSRMPSSA